jgi:hypothetical protein
LFLSEAILELQSEIDVIDTRHIAGTGWRRVFWMKSERVYIHKAIWNVSVNLVWLNKAEPGAGLVREARLVIEVESRRNDWITVVNAGPVEPVVALFLALATNRPH